MAKRKKSLLYALLAVVLLVGALIAVKSLKNLPQAPEDTGKDILLSLSGIDSYSLTYQGETLSFYKTENGWKTREYPQVEIDQSYPNSLISALAEVNMVRNLGEQQELASFGLSPAECTLCVKGSEGEKTLYIGKAGTAGNDYYLLVEGEASVYLVDSALGNAAKHDICAMVYKEPLPTLTDVTRLAYGDNELLYRKEGSTAVYSPEYTWFWQNKPDATEDFLGIEQVEALIDGLSGLNWNKVEKAWATDAELLACGLGDSAYTLTIDYTKTVEVGKTEEGEAETVSVPTTFVLRLGKSFQEQEQTLIYAQIPGSQVIYSLDAGIMDRLEQATRESLLPTDVMRMDWSSVSTLYVTAAGKSLQINIAPKQVKDEEGNVSTQYTYSTGNAALDTSLTEAFIDYLSNMTAEGTTDHSEKAGEVELEMVIERKTTDAFQKMTFVLKQYDQNFSLVSFNGAERILVSKKDTAELLHHFSNIR